MGGLGKLIGNIINIAVNAGGYESYTGPEETQTFEVGEGDRVTIENVSGNITAGACDGSSATLWSQKTCWGYTDSDAMRAAETLKIAINRIGKDVYIKAIPGEGYPKEPLGKKPRVEYRLLVPKGVSITLKSVSGDIDATDVGPEVRCDTVSGGIRASGCGDSRVHLKSVSGNLGINRCKGSIDLNSVSGGIDISECEGRFCIKSVSGWVGFRHSSASHFEAESVSGGVKGVLKLADGGYLRAKTVSGGIDIDLPADLNARFECNTTSGGIHIGFPAMFEKSGGRHVIAKSGDGSANVRGETVSGGIRFNAIQK